MFYDTSPHLHRMGPRSPLPPPPLPPLPGPTSEKYKKKTEKQSIFLCIQVRANSQTKGLDRG